MLLLVCMKCHTKHIHFYIQIHRHFQCYMKIPNDPYVYNVSENYVNGKSLA